MDISVFGLGYVGCVSLGCLANNGHNVIGVEVVDNKIDLINSGKPTIIEKDIDKIIDEQWRKDKVSATKDYNKAVLNSKVSIICVGTPSTKEGHLDLKYIYKTAEQIGEALMKKTEFHIVVIRSTVLPGTNQKVGEIVEKISGKKRNEDFAVISNPEFLREGTAVADYYNPAITVLGGDNEMALRIMSDIYSDINAPIEKVDIKVAEFIKYVNNSFHALKITFANEIGNISKKLGINSHQVMQLFGKDDQLNISTYYFRPGFAYGGSCLPKDLLGLKTLAHDFYLKSPLLNAIEDSNENQKDIAFNMVKDTGNKKIGILGLSFKEGTDDLRYSPIVAVAERLLGSGYSVSIYDKNVNYTKITGTNKDFINLHIPHLSNYISDDLDSVLKKSDTIIIAHMDKTFKGIVEKYPAKIFIDLVNIMPKSTHSLQNYDGICW